MWLVTEAKESFLTEALWDSRTKSIPLLRNARLEAPSLRPGFRVRTRNPFEVTGDNVPNPCAVRRNSVSDIVRSPRSRVGEVVESLNANEFETEARRRVAKIIGNGSGSTGRDNATL